MGLFNKKKKQEEPQSRVAAIIYNATHYILDDHPVAPQRKHFDLAIIDTNGTLSATPTQPVIQGREAAYNKALKLFYNRAFDSDELPQDLEYIKEKINKALWCYITIF